MNVYIFTWIEGVISFDTDIAHEVKHKGAMGFMSIDVPEVGGPIEFQTTECITLSFTDEKLKYCVVIPNKAQNGPVPSVVKLSSFVTLMSRYCWKSNVIISKLAK